MKLNRGMLAAGMVAMAIAAVGCKSSSDQGDASGNAADPSQSAAQAPNDPSGPRNGSDDPGAHRGRRHRGPRHGQGDFHRRRAWAQDPGSDNPGGRSDLPGGGNGVPGGND